MLTIKCPQCGNEIEIGKDEYDALLSKIEKTEINSQVDRRVEEIKKSLEAQEKLSMSIVKTQNEQQVQKLKGQIELLNKQIENSKTTTELEVKKAVEQFKEQLSEKEAAISELKGNASLSKKDYELSIEQLKQQYEFQLKAKEEEIKHWKEFRLGDSTKDLGESLENYCRDVFEQIHSVAYPNATFIKDNIVDEEGKGDYIFRDYVDGIESVSIMFEMKNQNDTTKTKHKNEDFFAKLDKNRTSKGCEYAVLVTTLEEDSKLYNNGIVDVSHRYPKMLVIRPQYFMTVIGILSNMARRTVEYKKQLIEYQEEHIDVANFENTVKAITDKIGKDYEKAAAQYSEVEEMCDTMIKRLEKFKESFRLGMKWIGAAQGQLPNLSIKTLTKNNPTMAARFDAIETERKEDK